MSYDPELAKHGAIFVYPIVHDLTGNPARKRWETLGTRWRPWWTRLNDEHLAQSLEGTSFFLPYVQMLLFPELCHLQREPTGVKYDRWTRLVRRMTEPGLATFVDALPSDAALRLTLAPETLAQLASFVVEPAFPNEPQVRGRLGWVDLFLFPSGLGFLVTKATLDEPPTLGRLIRLNRALQTVHPPSLAFALPKLRTEDGVARPLAAWIDALLAGVGVGAAWRETWTLDAPPGYTDSEPGRAYGERAFTLSYACTQFDRERADAGAFPDSEARVLFELAAGIPLGQTVDNPMWTPSATQAQRYQRDHTLSVWRCWSAMALKESLAFFATEDLPFTRRTLARVIQTDYLPLYVYALHQRFQLSVFANDLMREVALVDEHLRGARALLNRFVAFRNRYLFSEVTCKAQGSQLYRMLQHGLEVDSLQKMVTDSVKEAKEFYQEQWDRQRETVVKAFGFVAGPLVAAYGAARYWFTTLDAATLGLALTAVLVGSSSVLLTLFVLRPKRTPRLPPPLAEPQTAPKPLPAPRPRSRAA